MARLNTTLIGSVREQPHLVLEPKNTCHVRRLCAPNRGPRRALCALGWKRGAPFAATRRRACRSGSQPTGDGRAGSAADAMRSTPTRCAAGKRARRFLTATSVTVIRVAQPNARRTCAHVICRTHASLSRRGGEGYEPGAVSRRVERRRLPSPLAGRVRRSVIFRRRSLTPFLHLPELPPLPLVG
jgi:hypothetical protein